MDSRQQFEENMRTKQKFEDGDFRIVSNGRYYWGTTQFAWEVWSESRESLVITLPDRANTRVDCGGWPLDSGSHRVNGTIDKCKDAIHALGIRTK